jgi:hypothetical protein
MARFLIEVPHDSGIAGCAAAVETFLKTGSHFLTHADWGCKDGDHRAWIILDVDSRDDARAVIPPLFRGDARVVQLNTWTMREVDEIRKAHGL